MRLLSLFLFALAQLCVAQQQSDSKRDSAFEKLVLADLRRPFPSDAELAQRLASHRKDFERLVAMAKEDKELIRIAPDFTWTTSTVKWPRPDSELGFSKQRWDEYRRLFSTLGIEAGVLRPWDHRDALYLLVQTKGLVTGGFIKGYAYSDVTLEPHCDSLDNLKALHSDSGLCFKPLDGKWYLYLEFED